MRSVTTSNIHSLSCPYLYTSLQLSAQTWVKPSQLT
ncbi:unnamed protein product [Timema podura]|uniref:Uncharacterized protein n=1 Tax=Timema podura TaxID=61482 RepID=A0ABN7P1C7_TIMPD|nr:unnamed protein product [Timema podura]